MSYYRDESPSREYVWVDNFPEDINDLPADNTLTVEINDSPVEIKDLPVITREVPICQIHKNNLRVDRNDLPVDDKYGIPIIPVDMNGVPIHVYDSDDACTAGRITKLLTILGVVFFVVVSCHNIDEYCYNFPWNLPARKVEANYLYLSYLILFAICSFTFWSGYSVGLPVPSRAGLSTEEYQREILACIRSTFGAYSWIWNGLFRMNAEDTASMERECLAENLTDPRSQPMAIVHMYSKEILFWCILTPTFIAMWFIQMTYNDWGKLDSLWEVPSGDHVAYGILMLQFMMVLLGYRATGWYWKQVTLVQEIRHECLRYKSMGLGETEKNKCVGLNAREQLEWWIWDVLKNEMAQR